MLTGIIGAGFGLYGYLPAVLQSEKQVVLTAKTKEKFSGRKELKQFADRIIWVADADELLETVETLIVSTLPDVQKRLIFQAAAKENIKNFILEKPLALNAADANEIIDLLERHRKNFRINYSFFYTEWFKNLERIFSDESRTRNSELEIIWNFKAHHYANNLSNWKRFSSQGGGVVNFFGIHLIAVVSRLQFSEIISAQVKGYNKDDICYFSAAASDQKADVCNIRVNADSETNLFRVVIKSDSFIEENIIFEAENPFAENSGNAEFSDLDVRVPLISQLICEVKEQETNRNLLSLYKKINDLWLEIEKRELSSFSIIS